MVESVILQTPILLSGFAVALALCIFALVQKMRVAATLISIAIFVATATYSLLLGAQLYEVAVCAVAFFALNLFVSWHRRGKR